MRKAIAGVAVVVLAAASDAALAGSIKGTVKLAKASEAEHTVVYLENVPEGNFGGGAARPAKLSQRGANFTPGVLPVVRGTQVDMSNDDWVSHNAFSKSTTKAFDLGIYAQDVRKVVTFEKVGVVDVFCSIHPRMNAVVLVLQNPFFAKPTRDGSFSLDNVPPGTYQLRVYRLGEGATPGATVKVPASGTVETGL